jgi:dCMP deaminase
MRLTKQEVFMNIAEQWSKLSTCSSRVAVGAVLVNSFGQIIASGYNGSPRGFPHCDEEDCEFDSDGHCVRAIHAEINVIIQCARTGVQCNDCDLYVTHSPCPRCSIVIVQSGISRVFYRDVYREVYNSEKILELANIKVMRIK